MSNRGSELDLLLMRAERVQDWLAASEGAREWIGRLGYDVPALDARLDEAIRTTRYAQARGYVTQGELNGCWIEGRAVAAAARGWEKATRQLAAAAQALGSPEAARDIRQALGRGRWTLARARRASRLVLAELELHRATLTPVGAPVVQLTRELLARAEAAHAATERAEQDRLAATRHTAACQETLTETVRGVCSLWALARTTSGNAFPLLKLRGPEDDEGAA